MSNDITILLVEDNWADVLLTREAFESLERPVDLQVVRDGVEALAYLRRASPFEQSARPDLVLLDLNLPLKGGMQVLRELKADPSLRHIPVIILSTSQDDEERMSAYREQASSYLVKSLDFQTYLRTIQAFGHYWLRSARLPPRI
ncbi:response regulator [Deinococcus sp.]|uniref:response regulator n=1 Tax=Deinococcus sp. TaxID=47478 RepID=UPI003CC55B7B